MFVYGLLHQLYQLLDEAFLMMVMLGSGLHIEQTSLPLTLPHNCQFIVDKTE